MLREYLFVPGMGETTARAVSRQAGDAPPRAQRRAALSRVRAHA